MLFLPQMVFMFSLLYVRVSPRDAKNRRNAEKNKNQITKMRKGLTRVSARTHSRRAPFNKNDFRACKRRATRIHIIYTYSNIVISAHLGRATFALSYLK